MNILAAVEGTTYDFDKLFTYKLPKELEYCEKGMRVLVPFGTGNKTRLALVMGFTTEDPGKLKSVQSVLDSKPLISEEMLQLVSYIRDKYFCTYFDAVRLMLPAGLSYSINKSYEAVAFSASDIENLPDDEKALLVYFQAKNYKASESELEKEFSCKNLKKLILKLKEKGFIKEDETAVRKLKDASDKMIKALDCEGVKLTEKQSEVYTFLKNAGAISVKELIYYTGVTVSVINSIVKKGVAETFVKEVYRKPSYTEWEEKSRADNFLSEEQEKVFNKLLSEYESGKGNVSLLYGVTGSGKTQVFLKLIEHVINKGKEVILMVPEISLTPQTIDIFRAKFKNKIAVLHSSLSLGERLDEWKRIERKEAKLVIGTRSAVFAPCSNLGLIVMDEEQEHTYKSENSPRYHARDIARVRAHYNNALLLLSSATPSVESYYMAKNNKYGFNMLTKRYGEANIPDVMLVDMNEESVAGNTTGVSAVLLKELKNNVESKHQSILLRNRRGYNTFVKCSNCREVVTCPNCSISLTYHQANKRLMCHYCGYSVPFSEVCPSCGESKIKLSGSGTQLVEEYLETVMPEARILRIDADTTAAKDSLKEKLDAFSRGEYDILVGTQMVAKGLDFENVTLVGVLSADQSLFGDDFRSSENTFDLLTQVIGRAGRGKYPGKAIIQTEIPENPYLKLSAEQNYLSFFDMEICYRKAMLYPPYADLVLVGFLSESEKDVSLAANTFLKNLTGLAESKYQSLPLRFLRPSPASVNKVGGKYRYKIIIKCKNTLKFREMLREALLSHSNIKELRDVTVYVDVDPINII